MMMNNFTAEFVFRVNFERLNEICNISQRVKCVYNGQIINWSDISIRSVNDETGVMHKPIIATGSDSKHAEK